MKADSLKARQIEAAAQAMWARDWFFDRDDDRMRAEGPTRRVSVPVEWDKEPKSVKQSYRDAALRALTAAAAVRERETSR